MNMDSILLKQSRIAAVQSLFVFASYKILRNYSCSVFKYHYLLASMESQATKNVVCKIKSQRIPARYESLSIVQIYNSHTF